MIEVQPSVKKPSNEPSNKRRTPSMDEKIWFIKRCELFVDLTNDEAAELERYAVSRKFRRGDIIYFPGDPGESVMLVTQGRVKIKAITAEGKEAIFAFIEPGELFGELAVLDDQPRGEYAQAVDSTNIISMPRDAMLNLIGKRPQFAMHITKLVGLRRRRIENRLRNIMFHSNLERVTSVLIELLHERGEERNGIWEIGLRLSHQELASLIGSTRETVTVALGQLQLNGIVQVRRRRITILDREKLEALHEGIEEC